MSAVEKNEDNLGQCACPHCPSYNDCAKEKHELLYCAEAIGKSICAYQMSGCVCGGCPVHQENKLKSGYYCIHGASN